MHAFAEFVRRLRALVTRGRMARDIEEEMQLHLELRQRRLEDAGTAAGAAQRAARLRFGNTAIVLEDSVDAWGWRWLDDLAQDVRYAVRGFLRHKGFAATAIASLAIGIGANTAIFSVVNGLVLRPLPFPDPDRLVQVYGSSRLVPTRDQVFGLNEIRARATSFDAIAGYEVSAGYLHRGDRVERVMTVRAEREFFQVLGVPPLIGRTFAAADPDDMAVVAEGFWRRELGGDPAIVGRSVIIDDRPLTIVGIMPEAFQFPYSAASLLRSSMSQSRTDVWLPLERAVSARNRFPSVTARLKPGVTLQAGRSELGAVAERVRELFPQGNGGLRGYELVPLSEAVVGTEVTRPLFLLLAAVAVVLALACANVTNLLLVRMTLRDREVAVRAGLGAGPLRLLRQFLAESLLLSACGAAAGAVLASWSTKKLLALAAAQVPRAQDVTLDWRVFGFLLALCTAAGLLVGIAPALIALRKDPRSVLQDMGGRATMTLRQRRLRDLLVVVEVALAFVLAVGAGLLVRELVRLRQTDLGMETRNVLTFHVGRKMVWREGTAAAGSRRLHEIANRVEALPGVRAAGFTQMLPLQNWGWSSNSSDFTESGRPPRQPIFPIELRFVTPDYFRALGIRVLRGRGFTDADAAGAPGVLVINEALARRQFGSEDPVGRVMNRGTIVGVVADIRNVNPDQPARPEIYTAIAQNWSQLSGLGMTLVVSAAGRPDPLVDAVRSVVRDVDPQAAIFEIKTMDRVLADSLSLFTLVLWLFTGFAALAVLLAATGTYGVMAYVGASRAREFAVRMALGADRRRVLRAVLRQGLVLAASGLVCGLAAVFAAAPLLRNLPIGIRPPNAVTIVPAMVCLIAVAVLASLLPALRAARVDPMSMLRSE